MAIEGYNISELREDLKNRLDDPSGGMWTDPELDAWINRGFFKTANRTKYYEDSLTYDTVAGTAGYDLPDEFIAVQQVTLSSAGTGQPIQLKPTTRQRLTANGNDILSSSTPTHYYIWKNKIYTFPVADIANDHIDLYFYRYELLSGTTKSFMPKNWTEIPLLYALYVAKIKEEELEAAQGYFNQWSMACDEYAAYINTLKVDDDYPTIEGVV